MNFVKVFEKLQSLDDEDGNIFFGRVFLWLSLRKRYDGASGRFSASLAIFFEDFLYVSLYHTWRA